MRASGGSGPGVGVVEDRRYRDHVGPPGHPERPQRLAAVAAAIEARADRLERAAARPAEPDELLRIHPREHLERVAQAARHGPSQLDADTYVCPASFEVARLAAGGAIDLTRRVARGELRCGFAALRPPGHHAESNRAMGFCLFNNAAIAARAAQVEEGVGRILLIDFDVHHGNGTQHLFEADPSILYFSTHQYPYYPGTGDFDEIGVGPGAGATLNVPLPAGCGDAEYTAVMQRVLVPAARGFRPELILVSAGFDAHRDDPLAAMRVSGAGYRAICDTIRRLSDELCGGRAAFLLEGGYAESGLREGTAALLDALCEAAPPEPREASAEPDPAIARVIERVRAIHARHFPHIGQEYNTVM